MKTPSICKSYYSGFESQHWPQCWASANIVDGVFVGSCFFIQNGGRGVRSGVGEEEPDLASTDGIFILTLI